MNRRDLLKSLLAAPVLGVVPAVDGSQASGWPYSWPRQGCVPCYRQEWPLILRLGHEVGSVIVVRARWIPRDPCEHTHSLTLSDEEVVRNSEKLEVHPDDAGKIAIFNRRPKCNLPRGTDA